MRHRVVFESRRSPLLSTAGCVATSHPLAAQAGLELLRAGGNAADAAVATAGILYVLKAVVGLRTSPEAEALGIDLVEHAEAAYAHEGGEGFLSRQ